MLAEMHRKIDMITEQGNMSGRDNLTIQPLSAHSGQTAAPAPSPNTASAQLANQTSTKIDKQISFGKHLPSSGTNPAPSMINGSFLTSEESKLEV